MYNNIYFPKLLALAENGVLFGKVGGILVAVGVVLIVVVMVYFFETRNKSSAKNNDLTTTVNVVDDENVVSYVGGKKPNIFIRFLKFINPFSERAKNRRYDRRMEKERRYTQKQKDKKLKYEAMLAKNQYDKERDSRVLQKARNKLSRKYVARELKALKKSQRKDKKSERKTASRPAKTHKSSNYGSRSNRGRRY